MFPAFRVVFFLNHPCHRCHLSQRPPSGISPVSFHFQCPAGMHLCPNLFLVSSVFSSSIHFFQVQTRLSNVSYNGDLLWGVLRFPPIFSLILLFLSNFWRIKYNMRQNVQAEFKKQSDPGQWGAEGTAKVEKWRGSWSTEHGKFWEWDGPVESIGDISAQIWSIICRDQQWRCCR